MCIIPFNTFHVSKDEKYTAILSKFTRKNTAKKSEGINPHFFSLLFLSHLSTSRKCISYPFFFLYHEEKNM